MEAMADRLPHDNGERAGEIKALSTELATIRGPALYGYEPEGVPASEAFTKDYATEMLEGTRTIANLLIGFASRDAAT